LLSATATATFPVLPFTLAAIENYNKLMSSISKKNFILVLKNLFLVLKILYRQDA